MKLKVPYLAEGEIEREAERLLAEYAETIGEVVKLPVPVDEVATYHLALRLELADLHQTLDVPKLREQPDILGAIFMEGELILIDSSLDPKRSPHLTGRYRFSVGHEIGHWRLHRPYLVSDTRQASLLGDPPQPTIICRSSERKKPIEWQADFFASCFLMPARRVFTEWKEYLGRDRPLSVADLRANGRVMRRAESKIHEQGSNERAAMDDALLEEVAKPFARRFGVSVTAMRIRLEKLGLMLRRSPQQRTLGFAID